MTSNSPAFLYLRPRGSPALNLMRDEANARFMHTDTKGFVSLRIGVDHIPKIPGQLITFGHDVARCDIVLPPGCSQMQCHFFINPSSGELLLRDDSPDRSTYLGGAKGRKLDLQNVEPRQMVVLQTEKGGYIMLPSGVQFIIAWDQPKEAFLAAKTKSNILPITEHISSSTGVYETRGLVHRQIRRLGRGSTATVYLTVDLYTGDHLAVKTFHFESKAQEEMVKSEVKRELSLLSMVSHPNVAVLLHHQGWEEGERLEFFMKAYNGSLHDLLRRWQHPRERSELPRFFPKLMKQMLDALVHLHNMKIIHRDIKPENILFDETGDFHLTDFGLSKIENLTQTLCGTYIFLAPEMLKNERYHTTKIDVWSMGVLVLDVLDALPDYDHWFAMHGDRRAWADVVVNSAKAHVPQILPMLEKNPEKRYSARECLKRIFNKDLIIRSQPIRASSESSSSSAGSSLPVSTQAQQIRDMSILATRKSPEASFPREERWLSPGTTPMEAQRCTPQPLTTTVSPYLGRSAAPSVVGSTGAQERPEVRISTPSGSSELMFPVEDIPLPRRVRFIDAESQELRPQGGSLTQAAAQASQRRGVSRRQRDQPSGKTISELGPPAREVPVQPDPAENILHNPRVQQRLSWEASSSRRQPETSPSRQAKASLSSQQTEASPSLSCAPSLSPYALVARERSAAPSQVGRTSSPVSLERQSLPTPSQRRIGREQISQIPPSGTRRTRMNRAACSPHCSIN